MSNRFWSLPLGIQLATATLGATIPRYVLAFLRADGVEFVGALRYVEGALLVLSALATAITVTAGAAYVAHVAASAQRPLWQRGVLFGFWLPSLAFEVAILAPALLATMRQQPLACASGAFASSAAASPLCVLPAPLDAGWSGIGIAACAYSAMLCVVAASLMSAGNVPAVAASETASAALSAPSATSAAEGARERPEQPQPAQPATAPSAEGAHAQPQSDAEPTPSAPPTEPVRLSCPHCARSFETLNALNAHAWRCPSLRAAQPATVSANDNGHAE